MAELDARRVGTEEDHRPRTTDGSPAQDDRRCTHPAGGRRAAARGAAAARSGRELWRLPDDVSATWTAGKYGLGVGRDADGRPYVAWVDRLSEPNEINGRLRLVSQSLGESSAVVGGHALSEDIVSVDDATDGYAWCVISAGGRSGDFEIWRFR